MLPGLVIQVVQQFLNSMHISFAISEMRDSSKVDGVEVSLLKIGLRIFCVLS